MAKDLQYILNWITSSSGIFFITVMSLIIGTPIVWMKLWRRASPYSIFSSRIAEILFRHPMLSAPLLGILIVLPFASSDARDISDAGCIGIIIGGILAGFIIGAAWARRWWAILMCWPLAILCLLPPVIIVIRAALPPESRPFSQWGLGVLGLPIVFLILSPFPLIGEVYGWLAVGRYKQ